MNKGTENAGGATSEMRRKTSSWSTKKKEREGVCAQVRNKEIIIDAGTGRK